jgi:hypothetical protein
LVACQSQGPYIVACGGTGTILPQCNLPPPRIPQVCGPSFGTILPPCTGANNPIMVCGPSGTILAQCNFGGPISASVLNVADSTAEVDATVGCPMALASRASTGAQSAKRKPPTCDVETALLFTRNAAIETLRAEAAADSKFYEQQANFSPADQGATADQAKRFGMLNAQAFRTRAEHIVQHYFGSANPPSDVDLASVVNELTLKNGSPSYVGDPALYYTGAMVAQAYRDFVRVLTAQVRSYAKVVDQINQHQGRSAPATGRTTANSSTKLVQRFRLRRGQRHVRLRIHLPRSFAKALGKTAGKHARYVAIRVIVAFSAKPRPVVRFIDIPLRIQRKTAKKKHR